MTCWITAAVASARVEVGRDCHKFYRGFAKNFIPIKTTYSGLQLVELYMSRIVCLHGVPKKIVSDRGTQFTLKFWERLHETLDTQLHFSSAYHPQIDGWTERVNQILEDMLRACAL
jgi:transposase InsO family protein